jgi:hypothetical protein
VIAQSTLEFIPGLIAQTHKGLKKIPQNLLNPFQRVFAMSLGIYSEVDYNSIDQFATAKPSRLVLTIGGRINSAAIVIQADPG